MPKVNLILQHFLEKFPYVDTIINKRYLSLYEEYSVDFKKVFSYLHNRINNLLDFLNDKNIRNKHYNAEESRELIMIFNNLDDLIEELKPYGEEILINEKYTKVFETLKTFLSTSGGSRIPEDFKKIKIINYDPIFSVSNKKVILKDKNLITDLINIGEGAFSLVSKYKDSNYNKFYAIKTLKKGFTERELERFKKEFDILNQLSFPYVIEVYSYNEVKNSYTMEYCDTTLKKYIVKNNNKLLFHTRKRICLQFLYAINYIHSKRLLHRDISYNNTLLKEFDNSVMVKLSDFGLMKPYESDFTKTDTEIKGTIIDPSLESFKDYNLQNEIYSIGFIINFILTGKQSFSPTKTNMSKIIEKCTDSNIPNRYRSVNEIISHIEDLKEKQNP